MSNFGPNMPHAHFASLGFDVKINSIGLPIELFSGEEAFFR